MKRLLLFALIAIVSLTSITVDGKRRVVKNKTIPFEKLVDVIATEAHWKEGNLVKLGLRKLVKKTSREEYGTDIWYIYGKNTKATAKKNWQANLTSTGSHAYAIEVALTTDNGTSLYFKDKADHDAFMSCARNSQHYVKDGDYESLGFSVIEADEYVDGWYVITFHGG